MPPSDHVLELVVFDLLLDDRGQRTFHQDEAVSVQHHEVRAVEDQEFGRQLKHANVLCLLRLECGQVDALKQS